MHEIKEARGETTDDITIKTTSQNLDNYIAPHNIEKNHRTGQWGQPGEAPRPITAKFVRYNERNKIFRNKKKLKSKIILITGSPTVRRVEKSKEAQ